MPIIEFRCNRCHHKFEELILKNSEMKDVKCPRCESIDFEKLYSTFGMRCNGSFSSNIGTSCTGCSKTSCTGCSQDKEAK
ncbi:MAG TPA: zinc ribbon domain-containing protein [candidate division WOR-3 bacterium]|uniref:Zinc ribbon domain-containing protein n=1 Tax=candidate division WOR-3 bacterium TaxID=2052148 RepID=A0A9C9EM94_UNCW3|nr:zinc ribbon domain-containing protein [candidate division WOR-3 bacterium]